MNATVTIPRELFDAVCGSHIDWLIAEYVDTTDPLDPQAIELGQKVRELRALLAQPQPEPTCDTCQHWRPYQWRQKHPMQGGCDWAISAPRRMGDDVPEGDDSVISLTGTGPKFGCVHHKQACPGGGV